MNKKINKTQNQKKIKNKKYQKIKFFYFKIYKNFQEVDYPNYNSHKLFDYKY